MNTTTPMGMLQQPRPFFMDLFVELWERFGYYGVQGVLAVFFVKRQVSRKEQAFVTFGALLRWSMASFPLVAMLATTCWEPNAPLFSGRLCWRLATS